MAKDQPEINKKNDPWYKRHLSAIISIVILALPAMNGVYDFGLKIGIWDNKDTMRAKKETELNEKYIKKFDKCKKVYLFQSPNETIYAQIFDEPNILLVRSWKNANQGYEKNKWLISDDFEYQTSFNFSISNSLYAAPLPLKYTFQTYSTLEFIDELISQEGDIQKIKRTYKNGCIVIYNLNIRTGEKINFQWDDKC